MSVILLTYGESRIQLYSKSVIDECVVCGSVYESFKDYVTVENMDGENKYDAGDHGLQVCTSILRSVLDCRIEAEFWR